jgi:hypothetical protein
MTVAGRAQAKRLRAWAGLAFGVALLGACASAPPPPEWLQGSSSSYPDDRFVVGVAADPDPDRAAEAALASIETQTHGEREGAQIADTWKDPDNGMHWALAVLDREPLLASLEAELNTLEARMTAALLAADTDPPHEILVELVTVVALVPERDRLRERIGNLGGKPANDDAKAAAQAEALDARLASLKRELRIEVSSWEMDAKTGEPGDPLDENRRALAQTVLARGFTPASVETGWGADPVWLRVESKVAIERLQLHPDDTLIAVHWDAAVEITEVAAEGEVVAVLTDEGRAVHLNEREARRQADADARDFAAQALDAWLESRTRPQTKGKAR